MLSTRYENTREVVTEKGIEDNGLLVMTAGHDTSSILVTFLIRLLANDPSIYAAILNEHEQITMNRQKGQLLTWEDLAKMSYTWRIAQDLRIFPPVFGCFRQAVKDKEYNGYLIPYGFFSLYCFRAQYLSKLFIYDN
ncbi:hypothetical protein Peur_000389 [Populus x canadensis]